MPGARVGEETSPTRFRMRRRERTRQSEMITSTANKKIKEIAEFSAKAKARNQAGVFLAEGEKLFLEAPSDWIQAIYIEETYFLQAGYAVREKLKNLPYETVSSEVLHKISDTKTPQGIVSVVKQQHYSLQMLLNKNAAGNPLLLVLENIQDPGNLGTMFRTAEGAGASGIIMTDNTADLYQPKAVRSTMGSIYRMPFFVTPDLAETLAQVRESGIRIYAAHLMPQARPYDEPDYGGGCAFLIGNEGNGLKKQTAELADACVRIPMKGRVESLNAAMAAGILMYEAARQRRKDGLL